jgi:DNA-binding transcriptional LysR family regulator
MQVAQSDLRSLAVFRAVVEHRSFLGAQIALGLSQSAVSFHIKALEERFGFRLCRRGRGGFELTDRGAAVYEKSKALFLSLNAFESDIGTLKHRITGTLRLGLVDNTITDEDLPIYKVIAALSRKAPDATVQIVIDAPEALVTELGNGGIDIAILPEVQSYQGLKFSYLRDERHSLYCATGHPLFTVPEEALSATVIGKYAFVVRLYANKRELQHFPNAIIRATASNMEAQAMFVLSGQYLGYLPDHYAHAWVKQARLRALLSSETNIPSKFVIATRLAERAPSVLDLFIQELAGIASERLHGVLARDILR